MEASRIYGTSRSILFDRISIASFIENSRPGLITPSVLDLQDQHTREVRRRMYAGPLKASRSALLDNRVEQRTNCK